ncbi:AAA family ATPase [Blautia producta]|nr:AAA family ATPase [Blautia producta]QIB56525.1 AAA family ATPase [Blautia producta ATCC 27340 = DSM 2950]
MRIKVKSLHIENFKGCRELDISFGETTKIYGQNASGKTTIMDAFMWLLFDKNSVGDSKFQVRPLDESGNQIDNIEIKVVAVLDVDGRELKLQKVQKQKWVKPRDRQEKELAGNINEFEINDIPKKEKDYNAYITSMVDEKVFKLITSPAAFVSLKWQEQRDILLKLVSEVTDADVIAVNPDLLPLSDELAQFTAEELTAKAKKALSSYKKKQVELPPRIDEVSKSLVDIDTAELELQANAIKEQIAVLESQMDDTTAQYEQWKKQSDEILQKKMDLNEYVRNANVGLIEQRSRLNRELLELQQKLRDTQNDFRMAELDKQRCEQNLERHNKERDDILAQWKEWKAKQFDESAWLFDESSLVCPMCGQNLPTGEAEKHRLDFEERKAKAMQKFDAEKTDKLNSLEKAGTEATESMKTAGVGINTASDKMAELSLRSGTLKKEITVKDSELATLPKEVDLSDNQEFQAMQTEVIAMEEAHNSMTSAADIRSQLKILISGKREELLGVQRKIASADNTAVEERIEELRQEQKQVGQLIADQEKQLYLLDEFCKAKMNMLSEKINSKFKNVTFKLFANQINGGVVPTCECKYDGVSYSGLNSGHRVVAGLDIINTLQDIYEVKAPVFIDNAEGINDFNLPTMDCQMVTLAVSDDVELRVEVA